MHIYVPTNITGVWNKYWCLKISEPQTLTNLITYICSHLNLRSLLKQTVMKSIKMNQTEMDFVLRITGLYHLEFYVYLAAT